MVDVAELQLVQRMVVSNPRPHGRPQITIVAPDALLYPKGYAQTAIDMEVSRLMINHYGWIEPDLAPLTKEVCDVQQMWDPGQLAIDVRASIRSVKEKFSLHVNDYIARYQIIYDLLQEQVGNRR